MSKKERETEEANVDEQAWMGTLADLVFLLITFFVLLISMSSLNAMKMKEAFGLFDSAVGVMNFPKEGGGSDSFVSVITSITDFMAEKSKKSEVPEEENDDAAEMLLEEMAEAMAGEGPDRATINALHSLAKKVGGTLKIEKIDDGFAVTLPGRVLFPANNLEMTEKGEILIRNVAAILKIWGGSIDIVCYWSWHEASTIITQVIGILERNWVKGELIHPKVYPVSKRTIKFVMRSGE